MSKATLARMVRKFELVGTKLYKREEPIECLGWAKQDCVVCGKPMAIAPGQLAYYHKECRKNRYNHGGQI